MARLDEMLAPFLTFVQRASMSLTPAAGRNFLYFKTDGKLYKKDSAGVETEVGAPVSPTWTDYSSTSTVVGWSSFNWKVIYTLILGKLLFVTFSIDGTSNSGTTSFTLPANVSVGVNNLTRIVNNGGVAEGLMVSGNSTNVLSFYATISGGSFSGSGNKRIEGNLVTKID